MPCATRAWTSPSTNPSSPDRQYYLQAAERIGGNRACIAVARKLLKRSYHLLRELGDQALQPVAA
jgi:hypothetical protein